MGVRFGVFKLGEAGDRTPITPVALLQTVLLDPKFLGAVMSLLINKIICIVNSTPTIYRVFNILNVHEVINTNV